MALNDALVFPVATSVTRGKRRQESAFLLRADPARPAPRKAPKFAFPPAGAGGPGPAPLTQAAAGERAEASVPRHGRYRLSH